jgi:hypothetical protein
LVKVSPKIAKGANNLFWVLDEQNSSENGFLILVFLGYDGLLSNRISYRPRQNQLIFDHVMNFLKLCVSL